MEAKDTVMTDLHMIELGRNLSRAEADHKLCEEQADISFMAGIKEVVEWGRETCPHDIFGEGSLCFKRACDLCWRDKEWGVGK